MPIVTATQVQAAQRPIFSDPFNIYGDAMPNLMNKSRTLAKEYISSEIMLSLIPLVLTLLSVAISIYASSPDFAPVTDHAQGASSASIAHETKTKWLDAIVTGSAVGIVVFLITDKVTSIWSAARNISSFENRANEIEHLISGADKVVCLGQPNEVIGRIGSSIQQAINVYNVYASYGDLDIFRYGKGKSDLVIDSIKKFLRKDSTKWIDVISPSSEEDIFNRMNYVFKDGEYLTNYMCFRLNDDIPIINFVILDFGNIREKELYFGFGRHQFDATGNVFFTTNEKLIALFERMHYTLRAEKLSARYDLASRKQPTGT